MDFPTPRPLNPRNGRAEGNGFTRHIAHCTHITHCASHIAHHTSRITHRTLHIHSRGLEQAQLFVIDGAAEGVVVERGQGVGEAVAAGEQFKGGGELSGVGAGAGVAGAEVGVVELAAVTLAEEGFDLGFAKREVAGQPVLEQHFVLVRQAKQDVTGGLGTGIGDGFEDVGYFAVVQAGDDGGDHGADWDAGRGEAADGPEPVAWAGGAGFHFGGQFVVERGDADGHMDGMVSGQFLQVIEIAENEAAFGDDGNGLSGLCHDFEASAGDLEFGFDGLIAVGHAGHDDGLAGPLGFGEFFAEEIGCVGLGDDACFKVQAGGQAEVFVGGSGVAVDAAMLASAVGIEGPTEADVGRLDVVDDRACAVSEDFGADRVRRALTSGGIGQRIVGLQNVEVERFKPIGRVELSASPPEVMAGQVADGGAEVQGLGTLRVIR